MPQMRSWGCAGAADTVAVAVQGMRARHVGDGRTARFEEKTTQEWLALLRGKVPCAPVNSVREALNDEQVLAREMIVEVKHPAAEIGLVITVIQS